MTRKLTRAALANTNVRRSPERFVRVGWRTGWTGGGTRARAGRSGPLGLERTLPGAAVEGAAVDAAFGEAARTVPPAAPPRSVVGVVADDAEPSTGLVRIRGAGCALAAPVVTERGDEAFGGVASADVVVSPATGVGGVGRAVVRGAGTGAVGIETVTAGTVAVVTGVDAVTVGVVTDTGGVVTGGTVTVAVVTGGSVTVAAGGLVVTATLAVTVVTGVDRVTVGSVTVGSADLVGSPFARTSAAKKPAAAAPRSSRTARRENRCRRRFDSGDGAPEGLVPLISNLSPTRHSRASRSTCKPRVVARPRSGSRRPR